MGDHIIVYLIFILQDLEAFLVGGWNGAFEIFAIFSGIFLFIAVVIKIVATAEHDWDEEKYGGLWTTIRKGLTRALIGCTLIALFMDLGAVFIPNVKQAAAIYIIPKIIQNQDVTEIPENIAKLANEGLKELIDYIKEDTNETIKEVTEDVKGAAKGAVKKATDAATDHATVAAGKLKDKVVKAAQDAVGGDPDVARAPPKQ